MRYLRCLQKLYKYQSACFRRFLRRLELLLLPLLLSVLSDVVCSFFLEVDSFCGVNFSTNFRTFDVEVFFLVAGIVG